MKRFWFAFERFLTAWMFRTESLMRADSLILRGLGLTLGIVGIGIMWFFVKLWLLFGKKPS